VNGEERGDPTETALLRAARQSLGDTLAQRLYEIPFDADRKMMTTVNRDEKCGGLPGRHSGLPSRLS
jgi:magnesium-transporting ATPase (P-type)